MQIHSTPATSGIGAGEMSAAQRSNAEKRLERLQKQNDNLQGKPSDGSSSSPKPLSGPNMGKTKVIMGSGGDHAVLSLDGTMAAAASESSAPAKMDQKALIDSINQPQRSEEVKAAVAALDAGSENLRQRSEALDAEFTQHVKDLAQLFAAPDSFDSVDKVEKPADDSGTLLEQIAPTDQKIMMPERLRRQEMAQAAGNATQAVELDSEDGKREGQMKGVTQTEEPEHPTPTTDSARHIDEYL